MAVYLIGFALSILLIACSEKKRLPVFLAFSAVALLIPCLIAGLRSQFVGTDVMVYAKPLTVAAIQAQDLEHYFNGYWYLEWRNMYVQNYELGFSLVVYFVARLTHSLGAVLFVIQALMVIPVYIALAQNRKNIPVWLGMLVYYFLFFNSGLNMMRQWNAMALLILAFQMLRQRKLISCLLLSVVAFFFHKTAILALPIFALYWLLLLMHRSRLVQANLRLQTACVVSVIIFAVAMFFIMNPGILVKILSTAGLNQYIGYLEGNQVRLLLAQIVLRIPQVALLLISWKELNREDRATPFYLAVVLLDVAVAQLVSIDENALRISSYLSMFSILWIPAVYRACRPGLKRNAVTVLVILYCLFYWYYTYVMQMRHQTIPYQFF